MKLLWPILKQTGLSLWDELLSIVVFNLLTLFIIAMGPVIFRSGLGIIPLSLLIPLSLIFVAAIPPALFGLFGLMNEISIGNAVQFTTYFKKARKMLKPAYIWGGINLLAALALGSNIAFYWNMTTGWSQFVTLFFVGLTFVWITMQILALAMYHKLVEPGFKLAQKNSLALISLEPFAIVMLMLLSAALIVVGLIMPLSLVLITISLIALLSSITVTIIIKNSYDPDGNSKELEE